MRKLRALVPLVASTVTASTFGCTALLDVSAYHVVEEKVDATVKAADPCERTEECVARHGRHFVCRQDIGQCRSLVSEDCSRIVGNDEDEGAIVLGSILPLDGPDRSTGLTIENAIEVAMEDFRQAGNIPPVPGATQRRPLVMIACDDKSDSDTAVRAAHHLVDDVGVPAIIGGAFSGITMRIATEVTIGRKTLLLSPSATSIALTDLADQGLVWRTCPSDLLQAYADVALMPLLEPYVKSAFAAPSTIKVAVVHKGDSYGSGLANALLQHLVFNGRDAIAAQNAPYLRRIDFGDPGDPRKPATFSASAKEVLEFAPNIVFLLGTTETVTRVLPEIEAGWTRTDHRPFYVMADGSEIDELWQYLRANDANDELRKRILGTVPGDEGANAQAFRHLYASVIHDGTTAQTAGAANAYDALYNLAYSVVAAGNEPLTGRNLALGFGRQVPPGDPISVGASNINAAFRQLLDGRQFDFEGASGKLDYDLSTGEAPSDIQIWCIPREEGQAASGRPSSMRYDDTNGALVGTFDNIRTVCGF